MSCCGGNKLYQTNYSSSSSSAPPAKPPSDFFIQPNTEEYKNRALSVSAQHSATASSGGGVGSTRVKLF